CGELRGKRGQLGGPFLTLKNMPTFQIYFWGSRLCGNRGDDLWRDALKNASWIIAFYNHRLLKERWSGRSSEESGADGGGGVIAFIASPGEEEIEDRQTSGANG